MGWPKKTKAYLHSSKGYMRDVGVEIGLSEDALQNFVYALYEVKFDLLVNEDGTYEIIKVSE